MSNDDADMLHETEPAPEPTPAEEAFTYRELSIMEINDNAKCQIIRPNAMCCPKIAIAYVVGTPLDFMIETRGKWICQYHFNLIAAAAKRYGVQMLDATKRSE